MKITITDFKSIFRSRDPEGRKTLFKNRYTSCLIITLSGKISFTYNGGVVTSHRYSSVFLPKGLTYTNECVESADSLVFNFDTAETDLVPKSFGSISSEQALLIFDSVKTAEALQTPMKYAKINSELYSLLYFISCSETKATGPDSIVEKAITYMTANLENPNLTVAQIASHCFISEIYLRKLFAQKKNTTPRRVLTDIRMKRAYTYALEKRPVKEIALNVGYSDIYQFSRAFKKFFGHSPKFTV